MKRIKMPSAQRTKHLVDHVEDVAIVAKSILGKVDPTRTLVKDAIEGVDHDFGDRGVAQQRLEWAISEDFVRNFGREARTVLAAERRLE